MFDFIKNIFGKFFSYLSNNNHASFEQINQKEEIDYSKNTINIRDILKRKKTKVDAEDDDTNHRDKEKEKRKIESNIINLEAKRDRSSYVAFIKKQRMADVLKNVAKSITSKLLPEKKKRESKHEMLSYKLNMVITKIRILKTLEKRCDSIDISKSVAYLDEGMSTFINRVKNNIKSNKRLR